MKILTICNTGDVNYINEEVFVQQITVSALDDAALSDAVDSVLEKWRALGLDVQYRDDEIPEEVKSRILQGLYKVV